MIFFKKMASQAEIDRQRFGSGNRTQDGIFIMKDVDETTYPDLSGREYDINEENNKLFFLEETYELKTKKGNLRKILEVTLLPTNIVYFKETMFIKISLDARTEELKENANLVKLMNYTLKFLFNNRIKSINIDFKIKKGRNIELYRKFYHAINGIIHRKSNELTELNIKYFDEEEKNHVIKYDEFKSKHIENLSLILENHHKSLKKLEFGILHFNDNEFLSKIFKKIFDKTKFLETIEIYVNEYNTNFIQNDVFFNMSKCIISNPNLTLFNYQQLDISNNNILNFFITDQIQNVSQWSNFLKNSFESLKHILDAIKKNDQLKKFDVNDFEIDMIIIDKKVIKRISKEKPTKKSMSPKHLENKKIDFFINIIFEKIERNYQERPTSSAPPSLSDFISIHDPLLKKLNDEPLLMKNITDELKTLVVCMNEIYSILRFRKEKYQAQLEASGELDFTFTI